VQWDHICHATIFIRRVLKKSKTRHVNNKGEKANYIFTVQESPWKMNTSGKIKLVKS